MAGKGAAGGREVVIGRFMACKVVSAKVVWVSSFYWRGKRSKVGVRAMGIEGVVAQTGRKLSYTGVLLMGFGLEMVG
jgi:hypothetical protein